MLRRTRLTQHAIPRFGKRIRSRRCRGTRLPTHNGTELARGKGRSLAGLFPPQNPAAFRKRRAEEPTNALKALHLSAPARCCCPRLRSAGGPKPREEGHTEARLIPRDWRLAKSMSMIVISTSPEETRSAGQPTTPVRIRTVPNAHPKARTSQNQHSTGHGYATR